jgi:hypothetical protein
MQTKSGIYINSINLESLIEIDNEFFTEIEDTLQVIKDIPQDILNTQFIFVPGKRLMKTILTDYDLNIKIGSENVNFEIVKDTKFYINSTNIILIEKLDKNVIKIITKEEVYYFEIVSENLLRFESKLPY